MLSLSFISVELHNVHDVASTEICRRYNNELLSGF